MAVFLINESFSHETNIYIYIYIYFKVNNLGKYMKPLCMKLWV